MIDAATNDDVNGRLYIKVKIQEIVVIHNDRRLKYSVRVVFAPSCPEREDLLSFCSTQFKAI